MSKTIKGKTKSGFEYEIPKENLDNYELLERLGEAEQNPLLFPSAFKMFLGEEQMERLKDHIRTDTGVVPASKLMEVINEIMIENEELKN